MEEILAQQRNTAKPVTGKTFFGGIISVVIQLAIAQIVTNLLIAWTGMGLLNIAFYLYAIALLLGFMGRTVAGSLYMLKENTLYLQKMLGDSTISVVEIPLEKVQSVHSVYYGERLRCSYSRVTVIDAAAAQPLRMRLAFGAALFSARLARLLAGNKGAQQRAHTVVFCDEGKRHACVFLPDDAFFSALKERLGEKCGSDGRNRENTPVTLWAQALQRAFPALYGQVEPLMSEEQKQAAMEEIARQKQQKGKKDAQSGKSDGAEAAENKEEAGKGHEVQDDTL